MAHAARTDTDWLASAPWRGAPHIRPGHQDVQFEEGLGWDTDVPANFRVGLSSGSGARPNQNLNVFEKAYDQTMRERAHVGSAAWVEAPDHLRAFASAATTAGRARPALTGEADSGQAQGVVYQASPGAAAVGRPAADTRTGARVIRPAFAVPVPAVRCHGGRAIRP
jgi:hypothetical protein